MDKLILLVSHPVDGLLLLIGGAIASIFGTFIKDGILKILSLFSSKYKKRRISIRRNLHHLAHLLMQDSTYMSLYLFKTVRMSILWSTYLILCILMSNMLHQKIDLYEIKQSLGFDMPSVRDFSNSGVLMIHFLMASTTVTALLTFLAGYRISQQLHIIQKALQIRGRQLRVDHKLF